MPNGKERGIFVIGTLSCLFLLVPMACVENGAMVPEREAVSGDLILVRLGDIRRSEEGKGLWHALVYLTNNTNHYLLIRGMWCPPDYDFGWKLTTERGMSSHNMYTRNCCPEKCFLLEPRATVWAELRFGFPQSALARDADEESQLAKFHIDQVFWVRAVLSKEDFIDRAIEFQEDRKF